MTAIKNQKANIFPNTYGLVLCGGSSSRMGTDKSMLQYYDKPQRYHVYEMLQPFCEHVFISLNEQQIITVEAGYDYITDDPSFNNIGPMAALLTAFTRYPQMNMLLIGCDYPFMTEKELHNFSTCCTTNAAAFYNEESGMYEPLLAWYPTSLAKQLNKAHKAKQFSLQHFLRESKAIKYFPKDKNSMLSIDTHGEYIRAIEMIKG